MEESITASEELHRYYKRLCAKTSTMTDYVKFKPSGSQSNPNSGDQETSDDCDTFRENVDDVSHCAADPEEVRMAAMKPRTGDGPLEVTKEGRGIVMRVPLEGGGRLVVEMTPDEAAALGDALKDVGN